MMDRFVKRAIWVALILAFGYFGTASCVISSARRGEALQTNLQLNESGRKGQEEFMKHCNKCHPGGEAGVGPALNNKPLPGFMIRYQVRQGLGAMPDFDKEHLSDEHLDKIISYLEQMRSQ